MTAGGALSKLGGRIARLLKGEGSDKQENKEPAQPSAASANPYQPGADRIRTTATWLTGALAAVATVLLAGTQLSSIGALSASEDAVRLSVAVVSVAFAVVAVAFAIYRLSFVQAPVETGLLYVQNEAAKTDSPLVNMAKADRGLRANHADLQSFLTAYDQLRVAEYDAETALRTAKETAAQTTEDARLKKQRAADVVTAKNALDGAHQRVADLRPRMVELVQLAGYLNVRSRFDDERRKVLVASLVTAVAIVCFAWAANPPKPEAGTPDAVAQTPVLATLTLTENGKERLAPALGSECAASAANDAVSVIVLSSSGSTFNVVLIPEGPCEKPVNFTVNEEDGAIKSGTPAA